MAIQPLKVINPAPKRRAPAKRRAPRRRNPGHTTKPRVRTRTRVVNPAKGWMDDIIHSVSAMGGGALASWGAGELGKAAGGEMTKKYAPVGVALVLTGVMGLTARRNMTLRSFFLGGIGALAADQAEKLDYISPQTQGLGRVSSAERIASILGTGPGRSRMNRMRNPGHYEDMMGYLAPGGPSINQTASSMGYLSPGGPFVNQTAPTADVY